MDKEIISTFYRDLNRRPEIQAVIPLGFTPGMPMLTLRQDNLCVVVPFLRYKITGEKDCTLVYPIRYVAEYIVPEFQLVQFADLAFTKYADKIDLDKPCGRFRHEAVAKLSHKEYDELRERTLNSFDKAVDVLLNGGSYLVSDQELMSTQLQTIVEPSLWDFYRTLAPQFYNKYFTNGKDK